MGLICLLLLTVTAAQAQVQAPHSVPRWGMWEAVLKSRRHYLNPFTEVTVTATFFAPSGNRFTVGGFYDGDNVWRVRFMPDEVGRWRWIIRAEPPDENMSASGNFVCTPSRLHGPLRVNPQNPLWFTFADGTPVYLLAFHLWNLDALAEPTLAKTLDFLQAQGFNAIVGPHLFPERTAWAQKADGRPDFERFNLTVWRGLDRALQLAAQRQMVVIPFSIVGGTNGLPKAPADALDLLLRYWVARWQGFWNATFQPTSEWEEGYSLDEILRIGDRLHQLTHGRFLISVHSLRANAEAVQKAAWFGYHTVQDKLNDHNFGKYVWLAELFGRIPKPILAHECLWEGNFYQREAGLDVDNLRKAAWVIALSGGQINYADEVVPPRRWQRLGDVGTTFSELGTAMSPQGLLYPALTHLARFFRALPFWRMTPHPELTSTKVCLAEVGALYAVFVPDGQAVRVTLPVRQFVARWFNPRTGKWHALQQTVSGPLAELTPPDVRDWVLLIKSANRAH
ncbi:hypothetical protein HRbin17_00912 [bacterium HR17]|uniref:DUF5060 domain-containing protein n=1 Tax=Candidatus Fervidibacter japonicus TaxID=2035412 RepID=A0A2H5XB34_9BACT|nr:hypothetical protein HRbin17_00912 [bacterium HR17]